MKETFVSIVMGSDSDWQVMQKTVDVLKKFAVPLEVRVTSAHRTPAQTHAYIKDAEQRGAGVFIAAAGLAAHLAGAVSAMTVRPVIGVPLDAGSLGGLDALLSTVQMPGGIPVATVAVGSPGAKNAAYLAVQILATSDASLAEALEREREQNRELIAAKSDALQSQL